MDNSHQCRTSVDSCTSTDPFNNFVFGLMEQILWLGYDASTFSMLSKMPMEDFDRDYRNAHGSLGVPRPIYWYIRSGKAHNEADATLRVRKVSPCLSPDSSTTNNTLYCDTRYPPSSYGNETFRAGFMVIRKEDRLDPTGFDVLHYIDFWNDRLHFEPDSDKLNGEPQDYRIPAERKIAVYELLDEVPADEIRYVLTQRPYVGVFETSGNAKLQAEVMNNALWRPEHRVILTPADVLATSATSCYTVLTEPHFDISPDEGDVYTAAIKSFVDAGGNFIAQCHGTESYENTLAQNPSLPWNRDTNKAAAFYYQGGPGAFLSTRGMSKDDASSDVRKTYNADLAIAQFEGELQPDQGGSLKFMVVEDANAAGSEWEWFSYGVYEQYRDARSFGPGTQGKGRLWRARGAKSVRDDPLKINEPGHNVYYLGGHKYGDLSADSERTNSQRLYMNALIIPATRPGQCRLNICDLIKCDARDCFGNCVNGQGCVFTSQCAGFCGVFSARVKLSGSLTSQTLQQGASVFGDMYYNFANASVATDWHDPAQPLWTGAVVREDVIDTCSLARRVFSCGVCTTLIDKRPMQRFFLEDQDLNVTHLYRNPTSDPTFASNCPEYHQKLAAQASPYAVKYVWGRPVPGKEQWIICAAELNDGSLMEFFLNDDVTRGVHLGVEALLPALTAPVDYDKSSAWTCPAAECSSATEVVYVVDEQATVQNNVQNYGAYKAFVKDLAASWAEQGGTRHGAYWSSLVANPATFQNVLTSFQTAVDGQGKMGGTTNWYATLTGAVNHFWPSTPAANAPPRRMFVLVGGPDAGTFDTSAWRTLTAQRGVEVFVYGVGLGSQETTLLGNIAPDADHWFQVSAPQLLTFEVPVATARACPANDRLCTGCNGWCCCAQQCCCPQCTGLQDKCNPRVCDSTSAATIALGCQGTAVSCDDNNQCTTDSCDGATGNCVYTPNAACPDDGNKCTLNRCLPDRCDSQPVVCSDGNACTDDACLPSTGCVYTPATDCRCDPDPCLAAAASCTDGNACTVDTCISDPTRWPGGLNCTSPGVNTVACQAALATSCNATYCHSAAAKTCPTFTCKTQTCDPTDGVCKDTATVSCDDNSACTTDSCVEGVGCVYEPIQCDDGVFCTIDSCDAALGCQHVNSTDPSCLAQPCANADCDDMNACTTDVCLQFLSNCSNPGVDTMACTAAIGGSQMYYCHNAAKPPCTGSNFCQTFNCNPASGLCEVNFTRACTDADMCTVDTCDASAGSCAYTPIVCDDGDRCTDDTCVGGSCMYTPNSVCVNVCLSNATICQDSNMCTRNTCMRYESECQAISNATTRQACVTAIRSGFRNTKYFCYVEPAVTCPTSTACDSYTCNPGTGVCDQQSTVCPDDTDPCTITRCDPALGCVNSRRQCEQFSLCENRTCIAGVGNSWTCNVTGQISCDDGKICTDDTCDVTRGCVNTPVTCPTPPNLCTVIIGCNEDKSQRAGRPVCDNQAVVQLFDFCGKCRGDNVACFFQNTNDLKTAAGLAGGIVAAIVIAAIIALAVGIYASKKGYDHYMASTSGSAAGLNNNPMFEARNGAGEFPEGLSD